MVVSRDSEPVSPTGRLRRSRSNPFQFADDLNPTLPRYAPASDYANEQPHDYAVMNSWNDEIDSIYDKYDEEGSSYPSDPRSGRSENDSNDSHTGAMDIELEHTNCVSVLSSPLYMTANINAANSVTVETHTGPRDLQESEILPQQPHLEREDSTIFESLSPPPALTQAAQATGHIGHALSTIFEASSPPGTTSTMNLAVIPTKVETPTPKEHPLLCLSPGPAPTHLANDSSNDVPLEYQAALHDNPYFSTSPNAGTDESTSIQTPSTGILFPKGSNRVREQLDHDNLISTSATDQSCTVRSLTLEEPDLVERDGPHHNGRKALPNLVWSANVRHAERHDVGLNTNIPNASIPKQWSGGSISRKRPSPNRDESSVHPSSDSSSESWEDITLEPSRVNTVQSPAKPVQFIYAPKSYFIEANSSNEYLPTPAGSVYEFTPSPAPRLSQELEQLAASMNKCEELERFRTPSPINPAYCPPHSPPVTPGAQITLNDQEVLEVIGSETIFRAEVFEDGPQRNSYDSFTTIELELMANPSGVPGKKNRLSKMMDPIWRIGSGTRRTQEVVEIKKAELEKKKKLPRSVVLHGNDSRRLVKAPAAVAPYRIRSNLRASTPELELFGASPAPYSPLPETYQGQKSSGKIGGHNAHKMSYLSTASITNSNLQRSSDYTRHSAIMDGRYPSPNVRRSYIENREIVSPRRPEPAHISPRVCSPIEMDPEDIEMQVKKPLKAIKPRGAPSYNSATLSEHDRNMLENSKSWHEFREIDPRKIYYPVGDRIYRCSSDGSRDRLVATREPAPEAPPGDGSYEQKKGEQLVWFALGLLSIIPFFIPLFIVGVFNEAFFRMTNNRWAAPNKRHIYVAIRILYAWGIVILAAIICTIIGLSRAASFH